MHWFAESPFSTSLLLPLMLIAMARGMDAGPPGNRTLPGGQGISDTASRQENRQGGGLSKEFRLHQDSVRARVRAARDSIRAERHRAWEVKRAIRDQGRRAHNIEVGAVYENTAMEFPKNRYQSYWNSEVTGASLIGLSLGYRTHFLSLAGYEAAIKILGANRITNGFDDCKSACDEGYMATAEARLLGGPVGRFLVMPSVGYTVGKYTVGGGDPQRPGMRYSVRCANVGLGLGFLFGARDELSAMAELGFGIGSTAQTLGILRLAYAFRIAR